MPQLHRLRRRGLALTLLVGVLPFAGCSDSIITDASARAASGALATKSVSGPAVVAIATKNTALTQTAAQFTVTNVGDASNIGLVTWTVTATPTPASNQLIVTGAVTINNTGPGNATLGNVVVNLQAKSGGNWATVASDVADATSSATTANIDPQASSEGLSSFSTGPASRALVFTDANNNPLSLSPEVTIAASSKLTIGYAATFQNSLLNLPAGTPIRLEVILSYGNALASSSTASNVDINGNGVIDPDEVVVQSVADRAGATVPAAADAAPLVITDGQAEITTTGAGLHLGAIVTSNGGTSVTMTVHYFFTTGTGTIKNCPTVTGPIVGTPPCDTKNLTIWNTGDYTTHTGSGIPSPVTPGTWLTPSPGGKGLLDTFSGTIAIGNASLVGGSALTFNSASAVETFLQNQGDASGAIDNLAFTVSSTNPTTGPGGQFAADLLALQLNVDVASGFGGAFGQDDSFGDLLICGIGLFDSSDGNANLTVRGLLAIANTYYSGGLGTPTSVTANELAIVVPEVNAAFNNGNPTSFAQNNLLPMLTHGQTHGNCP